MLIRPGKQLFHHFLLHLKENVQQFLIEDLLFQKHHCGFFVYISTSLNKTWISCGVYILGRKADNSQAEYLKEGHQT